MSVYYYNLFNDATKGKNESLKNYLNKNLGDIEKFQIKEVISFMINNWYEVEKWV